MKYLPSLSAKFAIAAAILSPAALFAADVIWDGDVDNNYLTPGNWDTNNVPTSADRAIIIGGTVNLDGESTTAASVQVNDGSIFSIINGAQFTTATGNFDIAVSAGDLAKAVVTDSTVTVNNWVWIGLNGGSGELTLNGDSTFTMVNNPGDQYELFVGATDSTGVINIHDTATLTNYGKIFIGVNGAGTGEGTLNMTGGTVEMHGAGPFYIGTGGSTGHATLSGDATIEMVNTVGGGTAEFAVANAVGSFGDMTMQDNATLTTVGEFWVGNEGGNGTLDLEGNASVTADSWVSIGRDGGTGELTLKDNASLTSNVTGGEALVIGDWGGGNGTVTVQGDATIHSNNQLWVGQKGGTGTLNIEGGTVTADSWIAIGRENGIGFLNVSGGTLQLTGAKGGNFTTAAVGASPSAVIDHSGGNIINTATETWLSENGYTDWTASGTANGQFGRFVVNQNASGNASATFTIDDAANYSATTLVVNGGGTVNFNGGTFTADALDVDKIGPAGSEAAVVNFNGGTVNIPRINIKSGAILDTTAAYTVTNGQTLAGLGSGTATMVRDVTVSSGGVLSTHDDAIGIFNLANVTLNNGAGLEFDLNGFENPADQMFVGDLIANGTISLTLNNLNGGTLEKGVVYVLIDGDGSWSGNPNFDVNALGGLVLDTTYGDNGVLFDTASSELSVRFAAIPEPGTIALLGLGLGVTLLGAQRRFRRRA